MDDAKLIELLRALTRRIVEDEHEQMALRSLLRTKGIITQQEWEKALAAIPAAVKADDEARSQSPAQKLLDLLRNHEGPKQ